LPDREYMREALARLKLRVHQDIVLNTSSVLEGGTVILLPAETRYETAGGGTATSTERRIRYTPEVPGPRIAEARPEWQIPITVARAVRPDLGLVLSYGGPGEIRAEMARAIPTYAGVEKLEREGQWVQWGGERLFADGFSRMPAGRATFTVVHHPEIAIPEGWFHLSSRRGKQFNSITWGGRDHLMGSPDRRDVLMHPDDAARIRVRDGEPIRLRSEIGEWIATARLAPMKPRHLQAYWPEANVLIPRRFDPVSGEPDYNALVTAEPVAAAEPRAPSSVTAKAATLALALVLVGALGFRRAAHAASAPPAPDSSWALALPEYQRLLDDFLVVTSKPGEPLETRFDYLMLRFSDARFERFARIHDAFAAATPRRMSRNQRHAWAIDAYNFLVIEMITDNLLDGHATREMKAHGFHGGMPYHSVREIQIQGHPFFAGPAIALGDSVYTLDAFERKFVFDGFRPGAKKRPATLDPRAHFALVCGAIGCPPLQPRAFRAESLDVQLERATRDALASPRHLEWIPIRGELKGSSIFSWYQADFGGRGPAFAFAAKYAPDSLADRIAHKPHPTIDDVIPWDWQMNAVPHDLMKPPKPQSP